MSDPELHTVAALMGDASRATMLVHLMSGRQLPASELVRAARVSPATAGEHLAKLVAGGLVQVRRHGRHRYYTLASPEVAHVVEGLKSLAPPEPGVRPGHQRTKPKGGRRGHATQPPGGALGTSLTEAMVAPGWLTFDPVYNVLALTSRGEQQAAQWRWALDSHQRTPLVRPCLDWSERRYHAAGQVGRELATWLFAQGRVRHTTADRIVWVTDDGHRALKEWFGLS
ncbi:MAG: helix-turn-helix domain-containing protein [Thermaerobacter sp.]|nr:helix-turn-helix domain-containing protein [Thermaerobacter sp.]